MKAIPLIVVAAMAFHTSVRCQEGGQVVSKPVAAPEPAAATPAPTTVVQAVPGEFVPPAPKPPMPAVAESDVIRRFSKAQGGRIVTMEELVPLEEAPAIEQAVVRKLTPEEIAARRAEWIEERRAHPVVMLSLSGTVYDHKATLLRWRNGEEEYKAWSNIDFNVMRGMYSVQSGNTTYLLFMMIGDESTAQRRTRSGTVITPKVPEIPALPEEPGFVVVKGNPANEEAMNGIRKLHELYTMDSAQFIAAYEQRLRCEAAAMAWEKANPPQPENVTIRWWRGKRDPQPTQDGSSDSPTEGGTP